MYFILLKIGGIKVYKATVQLQNDTGLHARPASMFVKIAGEYQAEIKVFKDDKEYNAKSIISVLSMGASKGDTLTITAAGEDAEEALTAIKTLVKNNFGE